MNRKFDPILVQRKVNAVQYNVEGLRVRSEVEFYSPTEGEGGWSCVQIWSELQVVVDRGNIQG